MNGGELREGGWGNDGVLYAEVVDASKFREGAIGDDGALNAQHSIEENSFSSANRGKRRKSSGGNVRARNGQISSSNERRKSNGREGAGVETAESNEGEVRESSRGDDGLLRLQAPDIGEQGECAC